MKNLLTTEEQAFLQQAFTGFLRTLLPAGDLSRVQDHLAAHPQTVTLTLDVTGGNLWPSLDAALTCSAAEFLAEVFPDLPPLAGVSGEVTFEAEAYFTALEETFARFTAHEAPAADGVPRSWSAPYGTVHLGGNLRGLRLTAARPWKALPDPAPWHPEHTGLMVAPNAGERFDLAADLLMTRHHPVPMGVRRSERRVTYVGVNGEVFVRPPAPSPLPGEYPRNPDLRAPTRLERQILQAKVAQDPELRTQFRAMTGVRLQEQPHLD